MEHLARRVGNEWSREIVCFLSAFVSEKYSNLNVAYYYHYYYLHVCVWLWGWGGAHFDFQKFLKKWLTHDLFNFEKELMICNSIEET